MTNAPVSPSRTVTLFTGMRAYTLDEKHPTVEALAVVGERIIATGEATTLAQVFPTHRQIDFGGRAVLPGLTDSHLHFLSYGLSIQRPNLRETRSLADAVAIVRRAAASVPAGSWVIGRGWDQNLWAEGRWPTRKDLDPFTDGHPVALISKDGHLLWVNSAALHEAGIMAETPDPSGGEIVRDRSGRPTGLLKEKAKDRVYAVAAQPDLQAQILAVKEATAAAHRLGITGIHDLEGSDAFSLFQLLHRNGALRVRVWMTIPESNLEHGKAVGLSTGLGDSWLRVGGVKIFADGTLGSQTASMIEPFEEQPGNKGIPIHTADELRDLVGRGVEAGLWPVVHAIGDRATRDVLDAFDFHLDSARRAGVRFRIEHLQLLNPSDLPRLARQGVIASMQPIHATSDRDLAERYWGARCSSAYLWRSLARHGVVLTFGSDAPIETLDPWQGLYAAVTRRRVNDPRGAWYPEEALSLEDAVKAYTVGAAIASGEESTKGSLAPGHLADFIVTDRDVMQKSPEELLNVKVFATIIGGRPVFASGPFEGLAVG